MLALLALVTLVPRPRRMADEEGNRHAEHELAPEKT
jgi:hypothetical protein